MACSLKSYRDRLAGDRYVELAPDVIVSAADRQAIEETVFREERLETDLPGVHDNRLRADAVLRFRWNGGRVELADGPNEAADPENRQRIQYTALHAGTREYLRLHVLDCPALVRLVTRILELVPEAERPAEGLVGVHALRTFGKVVNTIHQEGNEASPVEWVVAYVVDKHGRGATTRLSLDAKGEKEVAVITLEPGAMVMHFDPAYYHYVTPLEPDGAGPVSRDAVIVAVRPKLK